MKPRQKLTDEAKQEALEGISLTERLLVHILIELMETRYRHSHVELSTRLKAVGLTTKQVAAFLDTTPGSLAVMSYRKKRSESPPSDDAVARGSEAGTV